MMWTFILHNFCRELDAIMNVNLICGRMLSMSTKIRMSPISPRIVFVVDCPLKEQSPLKRTFYVELIFVVRIQCVSVVARATTKFCRYNPDNVGLLTMCRRNTIAYRRGLQYPPHGH